MGNACTTPPRRSKVRRVSFVSTSTGSSDDPANPASVLPTTVGAPDQAHPLTVACAATSPRTPYTPSAYWLGKIDDVRIWSTRRTDQEIADTTASRSPACERLVAYFTFEDGSGTTTHDVTARDTTARSRRRDVLDGRSSVASGASDSPTPAAAPQGPVTASELRAAPPKLPAASVGQERTGWALHSLIEDNLHGRPWAVSVVCKLAVLPGLWTTMSYSPKKRDSIDPLGSASH